MFWLTANGLRTSEDGLLLIYVSSPIGVTEELYKYKEQQRCQMGAVEKRGACMVHL